VYVAGRRQTRFQEQDKAFRQILLFANTICDSTAQTEYKAHPRGAVDEKLKTWMLENDLLRFWIHAGYSVAYNIHVRRSYDTPIADHLRPPQFLVGRCAGTALEAPTYICVRAVHT
jgi:hypothetical protein